MASSLLASESSEPIITSYMSRTKYFFRALFLFPLLLSLLLLRLLLSLLLLLLLLSLLSLLSLPSFAFSFP
ncbi:MAG: hypothetical protein COS36_01775 [Candidatus Altarchaeum sp. CG03_land_8_20_14_0_80_32_618]|nr:MAG: hypothetical protein COS36_01775 [Candidatus Altarchaeum sp. CG03_land_8_20_14_0_80_32_618]PIX48406.1 MAG: hypothetical protein COZ53_04135 [Candidatus Altarchaeum sp. CG_4_8_14_3_um_filter_33_2054]PIZ32881.1 MAG: hypothetical protein COY41_00480 [Candidatus Altarchaeum sp. CG_4_10_14_0_8_um_filter_32_851]